MHSMSSMSRTFSKRETAKVLIAALVASCGGSIAIRAASARPATTPIRHLVVIFQENVSFDHYFATYPHASNTDGSPFTAKPGTPMVNGLFAGGLLDHNPNSTQPFRLSYSQAVTCDQDHNYADEQKSFNAGAMNLFPETVGVGARDATTLERARGW